MGKLCRSVQMQQMHSFMHNLVSFPAMECCFNPTKLCKMVCKLGVITCPCLILGHQ